MSYDDLWTRENYWGTVPEDILEPRAEYIQNVGYVRRTLEFYHKVLEMLKNLEELEEYHDQEAWFGRVLEAASKFQRLKPKKMRETHELVLCQIVEVLAVGLNKFPAIRPQEEEKDDETSSVSSRGSTKVFRKELSKLTEVLMRMDERLISMESCVKAPVVDEKAEGREELVHHVQPSNTAVRQSAGAQADPVDTDESDIPFPPLQRAIHGGMENTR
jgi:DNA-directed RNA polymerase subunit F